MAVLCKCATLCLTRLTPAATPTAPPILPHQDTLRRSVGAFPTRLMLCFGRLEDLSHCRVPARLVWSLYVYFYLHIMIREVYSGNLLTSARTRKPGSRFCTPESLPSPSVPLGDFP